MNAQQDPQVAAWQASLDDPEQFWGEAAQAIEWSSPYSRVLDREAKPVPRWFPDGELNSCHNAVDRHVAAGRGEQNALIYDSPLADSVQRLTYAQLQQRVAKLAGAMAALGVTKGDRVIVYMPMIPEAVIAMLAVARLGAVHSVVFGGFAAHELAVRIDDAKPKLILAATCGLEPGRLVPYKPLLDEAIAASQHQPAHCLIWQREQLPVTLDGQRDRDWRECENAAEPHPCVPVAATDPLYILYTSGTTGQPKGVVRDNGGHLVALAWSMRNVYGVQPGEVFWAASDVGWVVGHSYIVYGPLVNGSTTVLYEGKPVGTPDPGAFWRIIQTYGVSVFFTAPTAFRAIKREDPGGSYKQGYDLSSLRALFLAGERLDPDTLQWARDQLGIPVIDHWWQTETGWPICANCQGLGERPIKPGSPSLAVPGWDVQVLDEGGHPVPRGTIGALVCKLPLPPGSLLGLWGAEERFVNSYLSHFPGYYETADAGYIDEDGYIFVMSRTDDVINVAGHRLSTGAMEEVLSGHPDVAECAVIGVTDQLKGQLPLGLVVLKAGVQRADADVVAELVARVRQQIGPVAAFKRAVVVQRLPKTRSGKILRGTMRAIADDQPYKMPATIDDPAILDEIRQVLGRG
ncbi:MAG: propionyl-CoA synthetase [Xanthomonadales bacterium]|nr:propionyl-CoA synthetase [Xanthomonadales bacterium]